ncbi:MAG: glutamine-hydrolyzing GMP synthase, partial [Calditrichota bacterium]
MLILDFGSQYTKLIARKVRELNVFSEIHPYRYDYDKIAADSNIKAIILSGGPASVYAEDAPHCDPRIFDLPLPILGICYGLQHLAYSLNGKVDPATSREYGRAHLHITADTPLLNGLEASQVWMSHGDHLTQMPRDFHAIASTENAPIAAIQHESRPIYGIQFHPEVHHTTDGKMVLHNFLFAISKMKGDWSPKSFIDNALAEIRETVGDQRVLCGLSGGVDSSVAAALIHKAIGDQLHCMFVDTGMMRLNEAEEVENLFRQKMGLNLTFVTAADIFLSRLRDVADPEKKRKIIGVTFIDVFEEEARKL